MSKQPAEVDRVEFDREIDDFVNLIKEVPCGRPSRASGYTLYEDIARLRHVNSNQPLGPKEIRTIVAELLGFITMRDYLERLLTDYRGAKTKRESLKIEEGIGAQLPEDSLCSFVWVLACECPDELRAIMAKVNKHWQEKLHKQIKLIATSARIYQNQGQYARQLDQNIEWLLERKRDEGMGGQRTNVPKAGLNAATARICELFCELTGQPQYGLVGQLLYHANLEDARSIKEKKDRYRVLSNLIHS